MDEICKKTRVNTNVFYPITNMILVAYPQILPRTDLWIKSIYYSLRLSMLLWKSAR